MIDRKRIRFFPGHGRRRLVDPEKRRIRNRKILKYCLGVFVTVDVLLGGLLVCLILLQMPYFNLQQVDVIGNHSLSRTEIIEAAELEHGTNLLIIDLAGIASRLRRHPWVRNATVYRRLPGQLVVEVEERTPRAILATDKLFYVDEQAEFFTRVLPGDPINFPLFTGIGPEELKVAGSEIQEMIRGGLALLDNLERNGSGIDPVDISQIRLNLDDGLSLYTTAGQVIVVGKGDFEQKMQRYGWLKNFLTQRGEWHNARIINLDFEDRAIVGSADKALLKG